MGNFLQWIPTEQSLLNTTWNREDLVDFPIGNTCMCTGSLRNKSYISTSAKSNPKLVEQQVETNSQNVLKWSIPFNQSLIFFNILKLHKSCVLNKRYCYKLLLRNSEFLESGRVSPFPMYLSVFMPNKEEINITSPGSFDLFRCTRFVV